jgi:hypothetical protein
MSTKASMKPLRTLAIAAALLVAHDSAPVLSVPAAHAEHDQTCHPPGGGNLYNVYITVGFFEAHPGASLALSLGRGDSRPRGRIRDGTSNTLMVGEAPPSLACTDVDRDGVPGITAVSAILYASRSPTPEGVTIVVLPWAGEVDTPGWHPATAFVSSGDEVLEIDGALLARRQGSRSRP